MKKGLFVLVLAIIVAGGVFAQTMYMVVNVDTLNVRNGPSADAALVGQLTMGTRVEVLDSSAQWYRIRSGNITGYVNSSYLAADSETSSGSSSSVSSSASAGGFSMAAGGGLLFDFSANNGISASYPGYGDVYMGIRNLSFGGFGFFDATYGEFDVSFAYGMLTGVTENIPDGIPKDAGNALQLGLTLLGKYPFAIGPITLFPLLGASYNLVLSASDFNEDGNKPMDLSQFGFLAGAGIDFYITGGLFLRGEALFQLRLASKYWSDLEKDTGVGSPTLGMGPRIKIGVGYRFF